MELEASSDRHKMSFGVFRSGSPRIRQPRIRQLPLRK